MDSGWSATKLGDDSNFMENRTKPQKRYLNVLLALFALLMFGLTNCSKDSSPTGGNGATTPTPLTFNDYIGPLFQNRCGSSSCHGAMPGQSGFNILSYAAVLSGGTISAGKGIVPNDIANSFVYQQLLPTALTPPGRMPQTGGFLSQSKLDSIAMWILVGAPES